jgi:hypothetical protein
VDGKTSYEVEFTSSGEDESSFELETETDIASFTGLSLSRSAATSTSKDGSSGSTEAGSSSTTSSGEQSAETTSKLPTFVQSGAASMTASSGRAERTAGVNFRMIGGVAGVLGLVL